jgi:hypothetical protein
MAAALAKGGLRPLRAQVLLSRYAPTLMFTRQFPNKRQVG